MFFRDWTCYRYSIGKQAFAIWAGIPLIKVTVGAFFEITHDSYRDVCSYTI